MLSIQNVSSAGQASTYYGADNYYAKDSEEAREASQWVGSGAKELGLTGPVDTKDFQKVLEGNAGEVQLGRKIHGDIEHRPGTDLTFSAPKSVSILALIGGDKRLVEAHNQSVKATLSHIEKNHLFTRVRNGRSVEQVGVNKMVAATFTHDTSRELDPQLHTHSVIANMVQDDQGKWRSLDNSDLYNSKMFLGALYRNELAQRVQTLGYMIERTHEDGRFDISGVSKELIQEFSQRSQDINKHIDLFAGGNRTAEGAAKAALKTRSAKKDVDRTALKDDWENRTKDHGQNLEKLIPEGNENTKPDNQLTMQVAREAVKFAMDHMSERTAAFTGTDLRASALHYSVGAAKMNQVEKAIQERMDSGELLKSPNSTKNTTLYTTKNSLVSELRVIKLMQEGQGNAARMVSERRFDKVANTEGLTHGQHVSFRHVMTSKDFLTGVEGWAGVGKTFMMDRLRAAAEKQAWNIRGFSTAKSQANTLEQDSSIKSNTIASFISQYSRYNNGSPAGTGKLKSELSRTLLVVDEATLTSTNQARKFLEIAKTGNAKVVMIGDTKQLGAVEAGKPFHQLQKAGMATPVMSEVLRQKDNPYLKDSLSLIRDGNIKVAFERHKENIIEVKPNEHVGQIAGKKWLSLPHHKREGTLVVAQSRETRGTVSKTIRDGLRSEGRISGQEVSIETLDRKDLTHAQRQDARNYKEGDTVIFERDYSQLGVKKGQYSVLEQTSDRNGEILLTDKHGEISNWTPKNFGYRDGATSIFTSSDRELQAGDKVRWTYNADKEAGVVNTQNATVKSVEGEQVVFAMQDGSELKLDVNDPRVQHFDYAFSTTAHASQGLTSENMIGTLEASLPGLTNQQSLYVQWSRAKEEVTMVVDNQDRVIELLEKNTGEKISSIEALEMPYLNIDGKEIHTDIEKPNDLDKDTLDIEERNIDIDGSEDDSLLQDNDLENDKEELEFEIDFD